MRREIDKFNMPGESRGALRRDRPVFRPGRQSDFPDFRRFIVNHRVIDDHMLNSFFKQLAFPFAWKA